MLTRAHRLARRPGRPLAGTLGWGYVNECGTDFFGTKYFALYGADGSFQECVDGDTIGQMCPPGYGSEPGNGERVCIQKNTAPDAGQPCEFVGTEEGESWWFRGIKDSDGNCTNPVRGERYVEGGEQPQPVETYTPPPSDEGLSCGGEVATGVYSSRIVNGECVPCGDGLGWNEWTQACEPVVSDIPAAPPDERPRPPDGGSYTPRPSSPSPRAAPDSGRPSDLTLAFLGMRPRTLVLGLAALGLAVALTWKRKKRR